jgi:hypothetical protein
VYTPYFTVKQHRVIDSGYLVPGEVFPQINHTLCDYKAIIRREDKQISLVLSKFKSFNYAVFIIQDFSKDNSLILAGSYNVTVKFRIARRNITESNRFTIMNNPDRFPAYLKNLRITIAALVVYCPKPIIVSDKDLFNIAL